MDNSLYIASLIGPVYFVIGLAILLNPKDANKMFAEFKNPLALYLSGMFALTAGVAILLANNVWEVSVAGLISLFGAIAIVKGVLLLLAPELSRKMTKACATSGMLTFGGVFALVIGGYLSYVAYLA